jgi:hypothetical protein
MLNYLVAREILVLSTPLEKTLVIITAQEIVVLVTKDLEAMRERVDRTERFSFDAISSPAMTKWLPI